MYDTISECRFETALQKGVNAHSDLNKGNMLRVCLHIKDPTMCLQTVSDIGIVLPQ